MEPYTKHTASTKPFLGWIGCVLFMGLLAKGYAQQTQIIQEICGQSVKSYGVDLQDNNGLGSTNSSYDWSVLEPGFQGTITEETPSGNQVTVDWAATPAGFYTLLVQEYDTTTSCVAAPQVLQVELKGLQVQLESPPEICAGASVAFSASVPGGTWTVEANGLGAAISSQGVFTAQAQGTVAVYYQVEVEQCEYTFSRMIEVLPLPEPELADTFICFDADGAILQPAFLDTGYSDQTHTAVWWHNGDLLAETSNQINVSELGVYTVEVTEMGTGCTSLPVEAGVTEGSTIIDAHATVSEDFDDQQTITVYVEGTGDYQYRMQGGVFQDSPVFTVVGKSATYAIEIRTLDGCGTKVIAATVINYPKFFTPNGDGTNDLWNIKSLEEDPSATVLIFDRYGKFLVEIRPFKSGWDGTYNGRQMPSNDYWFLVKYRDRNNGRSREFRSHFTLKR